MKSKSVLRRLEQLEKRTMPTQAFVGFVVVDHAPTAAELAEIVQRYGNDVLVIHEDRLLP